jgi:hypothetical protein
VKRAPNRRASWRSPVPDPIAPAGRDDAVRRLESDIARQRDRLAATLADLHLEAEALVDWRQWYRRHPGAFMGVALLAGWTLAALAAGPRRL